MEILNISSNFQNLKRYLRKKSNQSKSNNANTKNSKKMKTVKLGGGGAATKHEASPLPPTHLESGRSYSSRLRAFPMASSRTGTQETVDGNFVVEIYKQMVASRDPSLASSHL
ncbi:hypothetical protein L6452_13374 [Arctium lappa]|uniref:Uncharacterized protein n=1 Tax=Arctium lappa TaxID=4217 RepID=A0ACB9CI48_ARCLA|nr:hypothetical protein L6452_13374 [Arctium lappa]